MVRPVGDGQPGEQCGGHAGVGVAGLAHAQRSLLQLRHLGRGLRGVVWSCEPRVGGVGLGQQRLVHRPERAGLVQVMQIRGAAYVTRVEEDLRHGEPVGQLQHVIALLGVVADGDVNEPHLQPRQQLFGALAVRAARQ